MNDALKEFPKNIRFITEYSFSQVQSHNIKVVVTSAFSLFLLALMLIQGYMLAYNANQQSLAASQATQVQNEIEYWEDVANKYQGYRDVYYRIATLQYKLGNVNESQEYLKKALELDPNFPEGHVLGAQVGL
jgi:tetratricopeptide (TPR) repeat protein